MKQKNYFQYTDILTEQYNKAGLRKKLWIFWIILELSILSILFSIYLYITMHDERGIIIGGFVISFIGILVSIRLFELSSIKEHIWKSWDIGLKFFIAIILLCSLSINIFPFVKNIISKVTIDTPVTPSPNQPIVIKLGLALPLSGQSAFDGSPLRDAIKKQKDQWEADNNEEMKGYSLQIEEKDYAMNGEETIKKEALSMKDIDELSKDAQVAGIVGPFDSGIALKQIPLSNAAGLALISPSTTVTCLTESSCNGVNLGSNKSFFRIATTNEAMAENLVDYLMNNETHQYTKVAIFSDRGLYGKDLSNAFYKRWQAVGGKVVYDPTPDPGNAEALKDFIISISPSGTEEQQKERYQKKLDEIAKQNPDIIFFAGSTPQMKLLYTVKQESSLADLAFSGGGAIMNYLGTSFFKQLNPSSSILAIAPVIGGAEENAEYYAITKQSTKEPDNMYSLSAHQSTVILLEAIKQAIKSGIVPPKSANDTVKAKAFREKIVEEIRKSNMFDLHGNIKNGYVSMHYFTGDNANPWGFIRNYQAQQSL